MEPDLPLRIAWAALLLAGCGAAAPDAEPVAGVAPGVDTAAPAAPSPYADDPYILTASTVILISVDGFRWDYAERADTPTLDRLAAEGVRADGLVPAFPTKTFPNHYTLATGLWPAHHGIIDNQFYAPDLHASFDMFSARDNADERWFGGEPIWITAERQGVRAGTMFWVGSEVQWSHGIRQTWAVPYDGSVPFAERVDRILYWLDQPEDAPRFVTLYFNEPDHAGHAHGPEDPRVARAVETVDAMLGRLVAGLEARGRLDETDLVVVSDHGMTGISSDRLLYVDDHIDLDTVWVHSWGAWMNLWPVAGVDPDRVVAQLQGLPHASCARREDLPEALHFGTGERIAPVHCVAELGFTLTSRAFAEENPDRVRGGTHGYNPAERDMHGLLVARGPHLQPGLRLPPVENVHVYALLARMLEVAPAAHDGQLDVWSDALRPR